MPWAERIIRIFWTSARRFPPLADCRECDGRGGKLWGGFLDICEVCDGTGHNAPMTACATRRYTIHQHIRRTAA